MTFQLKRNVIHNSAHKTGSKSKFLIYINEWWITNGG